jgi:hypothetical protein
VAGIAATFGTVVLASVANATAVGMPCALGARPATVGCDAAVGVADATDGWGRLVAAAASGAVPRVAGDGIIVAVALGSAAAATGPVAAGVLVAVGAAIVGIRVAVATTEGSATVGIRGAVTTAVGDACRFTLLTVGVAVGCFLLVTEVPSWLPSV